MARTLRRTVGLGLLAVALARAGAAGLGPAGAPASKLDTARIEEVTGLKGTHNQEEGVFKVTPPRAEVPVMVDGWRMPPFMGLTSRAAFQAGKTRSAMVMGDLVLFEDEVNPVMSAALEAGLGVTALHNHFFFDQPRVHFMHIAGDHEVLEREAIVYDALYAYCREMVRSGKPEGAFKERP